MTTKTIRVWAVLALVTAVTAFSSCLKSDNVTPTRPQAGVAIINGILTASPMDFYDQGQKVNQNPINTGFLYSGYIIYGGLRTFAFKKVGQTSDFVSRTERYDSLTYNTLIAFGDSTAPSMIAVKDDFTTAKDNLVNFRFFHLSPNIGAVDLYLDNQKVDSNRVYAGNGGLSFTFKQPKNTLYSNNIKVKLAGTDSVLVENTSPTQTFTANRVYTIVMWGDKSFTDVRKLQVNNLYSLY
ncbi:DUF4397 domain-containing protein [Chitinophaga agri]|uniref:DUF4397 domain-containing protein n=1 Tax=Chitinophaga agri TaxID=2703787 RepID=A0A6B9ZEF1_9BACT|nr:DUF4397 domain-containing protein [Chitinophaga agri]QHS60109.1 DUF4397 domain-containing protein [Chitinophaga agri]